MIAEPGFREALTGDRRAHALPAVEDVDLARGVLRRLYRRCRQAPRRERCVGRDVISRGSGIRDRAVSRPLARSSSSWGAGAPARRGWSSGCCLAPAVRARRGLAAELCRRAQADGAVRGFLSTGLRHSRLALGDVSGPLLLVVVDEAHGRVRDATIARNRLARAPRATCRCGSCCWPGSRAMVGRAQQAA